MKKRECALLEFNRLAIGWLVLELFCSPGIAYSQRETERAAALKNKFLTESSQAWKNYRQKVDSVRGRALRQEFDLLAQQAKLPQMAEVHFLSRNNVALLWGMDQPRKGRTNWFANGINSHYLFDLLGRAKDDLTIHRYTLLSQTNGTAELEEIKKKIRGWTCPNLRLYDLWLDELLLDPGFQITNVTEEVNSDNKSSVRVQFSYKPDKSNNSWVRGGSFRVSPGQDWTLTDYDVQIVTMSSKGRLTSQFSTISANDGTCLVKHQSINLKTSERSNNLPPIDRETRIDYQLAVISDLSEEEVRLAFFKLPEPQRESSGMWRRWHLWIFMVLLLIVIGIGFVRVTKSVGKTSSTR